MSPEQAFALAEAEVAKIGIDCEQSLILQPEFTVEVDEGWIFFYNSREFIETGNFDGQLLGNAPIFIDRMGHIDYIPTFMTWQTWLERLRAESHDRPKRNPPAEPGATS